MKKLFLIPVFLICISGASPNKIQAPIRIITHELSPISTKVDSVTIKAKELNQLIRQE